MDPGSPYASSPRHHTNQHVETTDAFAYGLRHPTPGMAPAKEASDSWTRVVETAWGHEVGANPRTISAKIVAGWPRTPQVLKRHRWLTTLSVIGDLILLFTWMALAAFAIGIARSVDRSQADLMLGDELLSQARIITPTLFPILFAATVGRFNKLLAMQRVERGERLGVLDQLQGSTSFAGTLITAATTRGVGFLTAILVIVWSLSPLGGQASLRSFYYHPNMTETAAVFTYLSVNNTNLIAETPGFVDAKARANTIFGTSITSPNHIKSSPMDLWGNVKIPSIEALAKSRKLDQDGWYHIDAAGVNTSEYSSLVGIPIRKGEAENGSARMTLETSYWTLQCPRLNSAKEFAKTARLPPEMEQAMNNATGPLPHNYTGSGSGLQTGLQIFTDRSAYLDVRQFNASFADTPRRLFVLLEDHWRLYANCTVQTTYVESEVLCEKTTCAVRRIRESLQQHPSRNLTGLDIERPLRSSYFRNLLEAVPGRNSRPSLLSSHILDELGVTPSTPDDARGDIALANPRGFETLLAQSFNTYWMAAIGERNYVTNSNGANYTLKSTFASQGFDINFQNATGVVWTGEPIFTYSSAWLAVFFLAVLIPLCASVANLVLSCFVLRGPHLSMNFTTMAKDNPYVRLPPGGSAMGDYERSYLLRNLKVRYGDVAVGYPVGHIAIGTMDSEGRLSAGGVAPLDRTKARYYD